MIMHRDVAEILSSLTKDRGLLARLSLAVRVLFSAPKAEKGSWAVGVGGL